jgi:hypothetical protein
MDTNTWVQRDWVNELQNAPAPKTTQVISNIPLDAPGNVYDAEILSAYRTLIFGYVVKGKEGEVPKLYPVHETTSLEPIGPEVDFSVGSH